MKDPKVIELVKEFHKNIKAVNATWAKLQKENVYVEVKTVGANSYTDSKYFEVARINQTVEYLKEEKNVG